MLKMFSGFDTPREIRDGSSTWNRSRPPHWAPTESDEALPASPTEVMACDSVEYRKNAIKILRAPFLFWAPASSSSYLLPSIWGWRQWYFQHSRDLLPALWILSRSFGVVCGQHFYVWGLMDNCHLREYVAMECSRNCFCYIFIVNRAPLVEESDHRGMLTSVRGEWRTFRCNRKCYRSAITSQC